MKKNIYEILDEFRAAKSKNEQVAILRNNRSYELENVLRAALHPHIHFRITEMPVYRPLKDIPPGMSYMTISKELSKMYLFETNNPKRSPQLSDKKMYDALIQILETLEPRESEVLIGMLQKNLKVPGLTYELMMEIYPDTFLKV